MLAGRGVHRSTAPASPGALPPALSGGPLTPPALLLLLAGALASPPDTGAEGPVAYAIEATLDARARVLRAQERIDYRNVAGPELSRLYLHLYPNAFRDARTAYAREHSRLPWAVNPLEWIPWGSRRGFVTIRSVRLAGRAAAFTVDGTVLGIPLASPLGPGEALTIEIAFEVKLPVLQQLLGFRGPSYAMALWFPKLAVADTAGWRGERTPAEADFYADVSGYDVRLTVPSDVVVAATGEPAGETDQGEGTTTHRWRAEHARYFAWVADRRYRVTRFTWNDVAVEYLHTGRDDPSLARGLETIRAALDFYGARYGRYPHRTLVIAETPALGSGIGGVAYSQLIMLPADLRHSLFRGQLYESVLAHEIAHQWWGMTVGVRDDRDDWLNEGMAEFAAQDLERDRAAKDTLPRRDRGASSVRRAEYVNQAALGFDRKIFQPDSAFDDLAVREVALYAKASWVLNMLQYVVGRDTLDSVLRAYAARYRYRNARTADFVALAESVSGQDLSWFFEEWLDGTATLDYRLAAVTATPRPDGRYRSVIEVRRNGGIVMPVEVGVTLDDGTVLRRVGTGAGRERSHDIVIDSAARVQSAVLDPDGRLLETARSNNHYPRRLRSSFLPRVSEDDAYHIVHLPFVFYDEGLEVGLLLAGGRTPRFLPPTWVEPQHLAVLATEYNFATRTAGVALGYSSSLPLAGRRAYWGVSAKRDGRREEAALSARALFGPHLYRAPFLAVTAALKRERRFATSPRFDQGTVNSLELTYGARALVTDFYPLHGAAVAAAAEGGWKGLGSDWAFLRAAAQAEVYHRVLGGTKVALNLFAGTIALGSAPRQKTLFLSREGNFRAPRFDAVAGERLTAVNAEVRVPVGTGTLLGVAAFASLAKFWAPGPDAVGVVAREVGIGLRLFDNAPFGVQLDLPFWTAAGAGTGRLDWGRLSLRFGRPFRGPGS